MNQSSQPFRILAIALTSRGFGYAVLEGKNSLVVSGTKEFRGDKNARSLAQIEKMMARYEPDVLALDDVNAKGTRRAPRIKRLHPMVVALAKGCKLKTVKIPGRKIRSILLNDENGTKREMAEFLAKQFPDELSSRLPPKRKQWKSEDVRMDMFDAVALAVAFRSKFDPMQA